jgi:hypothetical protein
MSRIYVDRISPYQSGSLVIDGYDPTIDTGSFATTGSNTFNGGQTISGSLTTDGSGALTLNIPNSYFGIRINNGTNSFYNDGGTFGSINNDFDHAALFYRSPNGTYAVNVVDYVEPGRDTGFALDLNSVTFNGYSGSGWFVLNGFEGYTDVFHLQDSRNWTNGDITFKVPVVVDNTFTASLTEGYVLVGDGNNTTYEVSTGSFATTGSNQFDGTQGITGSVGISDVLNLEAQDPLPTGSIGDLAVSGSELFFYNGAWTQIS